MRAIWKGSISFGLVNIPVHLVSATREHEMKFVMLHKKDLSQIRYARICKEEEKEVPWEEIVKGYENAPGEYTVLKPEDFEKADVKRVKSIEIVDFIEINEIDSVYYEKPYYLTPEKSAIKAYALLIEALSKSKKVGIAKFVFHEREHLAVIKAYEGVLVLNQLRFNEELIDTDKLEMPTLPKASPKELSVAIQLIDQLTTPFKPAAYKDLYVQELREIIAKKAKGKPIQAKGREPKPSKVHDIMSLLEASLKKPAKKAAPAKSKRTTKKRVA